MSAQSTLEQLRLAIHGVTAPFSSSGTYLPQEPVTFVFQNKIRFEVAPAESSYKQVDALKPLLKQCKPAAFGDGKKTRYDRLVRDALQLNAEGNAFSIQGFDPESAGILKAIQNELLPQDPNPITAELYSVNVYQNGGHFAPHKDTPRGDDMFGTLVLCLPSKFSGGELILSHRGVVEKYDWAKDIDKQKDAKNLHWVAFFGDVNHEVKRVYGGARVTLTYLLRRGQQGMPSREITPADQLQKTQAAWQSLLADKTFLPEGDILAYPCAHLYHQDARFQVESIKIDETTSNMLKGRDQLVAATALQAKCKVSFVPYLFENLTTASWQLSRFPTSKEQSKLRRRVDDHILEENLPIVDTFEDGDDLGATWIENPPLWEKISRDANIPSDLPAAAIMHSCDYSPWGYFGNESSEVDFYTFAALHIVIPAYGKGIRKEAKAKKPPTAKPKLPKAESKAKPKTAPKNTSKPKPAAKKGGKKPKGK